MSFKELPKKSNILQLAINNIKDAICITDDSGKILFGNSANRKFYGIPDQDLPPEQWSHYFEVYKCDGLTPLPLEEMPYVTILKGKKINDVEIAVRIKRDSELRFYLINGYPIRDDDYKIIGTVITSHDITKNKKIERQLKQSEANYQNIIQMSSEAILIHRNGKILFANDAAVKVLEANNKEELMNKEALDFIHPDYHDLSRHRIKKVLEGSTFEKIEYKGITMSGRVIDVEITLQEIQFMGQKALITMGKDITKEKEITQQLKDSEERYRSLYTNHSDAIFTLDLEGNFINANPASEKLSGYKYEELLNKSFLPLLIEEDVEKVVSHFHKTLQGIPRSYECTMINKQGSLVDLYINNIPITVQGEIVGVYGIVKDITEQKQMQEKIKHMAFHDDLTGLANRKLINEQLKKALRKANEDPEYKVSVIFLDLDRFKFINDTLGHAIGDQLLIQVANRLKNGVRHCDTVARLGGDEFLVLFDNLSLEQVKEVANRILQSINQPFNIEGHEVYTTPSIGISSSVGTKFEELDRLMQNADIAMYAAKEHGKNNYQVFSEEMNTLIKRKLKIEKGLKAALKNKEFELYYQPQLDLFTNEIIGAEVLLRWQHPELGNVSPAEFIPIAEDTGLIMSIGDWVLQEACTQLKMWLDAGMPEIRISINLSVQQLKSKNIIEELRQTLKDCRLNPQYLCIEMTESIMQIKNETLPILKKLKKLGVFISIDDFGTGFSSLSYLKYLPIDELKIDKSFLQETMKNLNDGSIIKSIIDLGNNLKLQVIAEGIENEDQVKLLKELNCHHGQGYYFYKPLSKEIFEEVVSKNKYN